MRTTTLILILGLALSLVLVLVAPLLTKVSQQEVPSLPGQITEQQIINNCNSTDIFGASECVNNYVKEFYNYNLTEGNRKISFEQLRDTGGDCLDWARLYCKVLKQYGFRCEIPTTYYQDSSHVYAKAWDYYNSGGYVILDQKSIFRFRAKGDVNGTRRT